MIERAKRAVIEHKTVLLVILCLLIVGIAYAVGRRSAVKQAEQQKPAVVTQEQTQDTAALRAQLDISRARTHSKSVSLRHKRGNVRRQRRTM